MFALTLLFILLSFVDVIAEVGAVQRIDGYFITTVWVGDATCSAAQPSISSAYGLGNCIPGAVKDDQAISSTKYELKYVKTNDTGKQVMHYAIKLFLDNGNCHGAPSFSVDKETPLDECMTDMDSPDGLKVRFIPADAVDPWKSTHQGIVMQNRYYSPTCEGPMDTWTVLAMGFCYEDTDAAGKPINRRVTQCSSTRGKMTVETFVDNACSILSKVEELDLGQCKHNPGNAVYQTALCALETTARTDL